MSTNAHIAVVLLTLGAIVVIFRLIRSGGLRVKYSVLWLGVGVVLAILASFPGLLDHVSSILDIEYPPATFLLFAMAFLLLSVLHFSMELSRLEERTRVLAEEHALLKLQLEDRTREG